ncbi:MAG: 4-hydroxy-tetrahydrodipicolinate reductase [Oscillospiraceae bacterium]
MKVIVNGAAGHMGREVLGVCERMPGVELAAAVDAYSKDFEVLTSIEEYDRDADVIIDFSHHSNIKALADYATKRNLPIVVATTGYDESELAVIDELAKSVPVFFSANMSLGIAVMADAVKRVVSFFPEADVEIIEKHHNRKLDAPSGTALILADAVKSVRDDSEYVYGRGGHKKREKTEIGIHAVRAGNIVGEHEVIIATDSQIISLKHEAQSRSLFAEGAVRAAEFLVNQKPGLYNMNDLISGR